MQVYPPSWQEAFLCQRIRYVVDSTNWNIKTPKSGEEQTVTYSYYYSSNCGKYLVVTSPSGVIVYISDVYPGHISDRDLALHSFLYLGHGRGWLQSGDDVMADRGFNLKDVLFSIYCDLVIPPFKERGKQQFSHEQREVVAQVTHKRVHVERSVGLLKKWDILHRPVERQLWGSMTQVVRVCAWLTNETCKPMVGAEDLAAMEAALKELNLHPKSPSDAFPNRSPSEHPNKKKKRN